MSLGKPVLSFNVGSISEVVKNNKNGYLVNSGDYNLFIDNMQELKNNRNKLCEIGLNAKDKIEKEYAIDDYVKKIENLYYELEYSNKV